MPDDTRPTFGQALEAASGGADRTSTASPDTSSATETPSVSTLSTSSDPAAPATVATQPSAGDGTPPTSGEEWDAAAGPIPVDRHKAILENTRTRARDEAQQQLQQQYGWALQVGPEQFQAVSQLARQWAADPVAFVLGALDDLQNHPQYAPTLRSHVAKILASRPNGNGRAAQEEEPGPDIQAGDYQLYSAPQQAKREQWLTNKLLGQIRQEMGPLQQDIQTRQERDTLIAATQAANEFASTTLSDMRKLPHFTEQKAEIEKVFRAMPPMPDHLVGQAIRDVYIQVLATKVFPTLNSSAKAELLSDFNKKAVASARNPSQGSVAVNARPKSFEEALKSADSAARR